MNSSDKLVSGLLIVFVVAFDIFKPAIPGHGLIRDWRAILGCFQFLFVFGG
jgi:hypothetical protein